MSETMTDKGVGLGLLVNWIITIIIGLVSPTLLDVLDGYLFIIFGCFCVVCGFFCLFILKETKGLSNEEVANLYITNKSSPKNIKTEDTNYLSD